MFELSQKPINTSLLSAEMDSPEAGALVTFEGRVRNSNEGRDVLSLEYEAYEAVALKEGEKILLEARRLFPILSVKCVHRTGKLSIGEPAVWVGVLSAHRAEGFDACRYVIDQVKARVPIWKKEFYADGDSHWVNCAECASHAPTGRHHD